MQYDNVGRPAHQRVCHNGRTLLGKSYVWGDNLRLLRTLDTINSRSVRYDYDAFGSLSGAVYGDGSRQWRNPDAMGNVYDNPDRTDRSYARGGQLREDRKWRYYYDSHGNLVLKTMRRMGPSHNAEAQDEFLQWQSGDYAYTWQGNGMLRSVTRPDGKTVTFRYDALGRRIEKVFDGRVYRYLWDGDVILHEWEYAELTARIQLSPRQVRSHSTDQNLLRISSRGFTTVTATSLLPRLLVTGITASSVTTSVVLSKHTMKKVISSGRLTMTSMVTSATSTAVGSSFLSAS
nr:RHS repeat protein [Prevotella fusca]